ncbi:NAD-dependent epimerase/dehydratase family protein [Zunongwangia sp. F260]|uniref:UDP-glucose 4-epimerase n=1 Tax=Autumnicola lenta TaxID=3075593 RepID=A0ABU3CIS9_9FLAO|nr:NAD-dependent epimerase/dehydratase family protein [Zunongwangia sp. F260]MDT0646265.1 NAD-dependent epimerase/dehydratase family protein [Zunongwangia sp. F260]
MQHLKTILITGASGFIGSWLARTAVKAGYEIIGIDLRAPSDPEIWSGFSTASLESVDFFELIKKRDLVAVWHLAGGASVGASVSDPYGDFANLLPGTARLAIHIARNHPKARLFLFSSAAVYGDPKKLPISEEAPVQPISPYGVHKLSAEVLLSHYSRIIGLEATVFRIFSVYGPGLKKQLIWDVSQRVLGCGKDDSCEIKLFGTGQESRDFIYIKDLCHAVLKILQMEKTNSFEVYNMASGIENTIAEVAHCIVEALNENVKVKFDGEVREGDPVNWRADISRLKDTGFSCDYQLKEGIAEVAHWVKSIR